MPLYTDHIKNLMKIYEPWINNRGDLKEGAPDNVREAYEEVQRWLDDVMDGVQ